MISRLTSLRICEANSSSVRYAGSSSVACSTFSNATLIRSAGLFFTSASARIASAAIRRASAGL
jgi:hypothetical protein